MVKIEYLATQEIVHSDKVNLLILVDEGRTRQLVVITDRPTAISISAMYSAKGNRMAYEQFVKRSALYVMMSVVPEALRRLMHIRIDALMHGQYRAMLVRKDTLGEPPMELRTPEAVLLSVVSGIPMYIDDHLWRTQSTVFNPLATGTSIPTNTLPLEMLQEALQSAIDSEDYEAAKKINDEINNRFPGANKKGNQTTL
ncbi:MAG: bifunctional nuclease family protein [Bacteroidaceae bacterium]|nr:bifunctional nuclease family protein [Bacteroidaceae bacterium]